MLFSATFPQEVLDAAEEFTNDPIHVMSDDLEVEVPEIDQFAIRVGRLNKMWALGRIIANMGEGGKILIFTNTKRMVDILAERLERLRVGASALHGDMAQNKRERILDGFREGRTSILIATDVAAFLMWTAEPKMMARKQTGFAAVLFLGLLAVLLYLTNKRIWAPIKRKVKPAHGA